MLRLAVNRYVFDKLVDTSDQGRPYISKCGLNGHLQAMFADHEEISTEELSALVAFIYAYVNRSSDDNEHRNHLKAYVQQSPCLLDAGLDADEFSMVMSASEKITFDGM